MEKKTERVRSVTESECQVQVTLEPGGWGIWLPPSAKGKVAPGDELRVSYSTSRLKQPNTVLRVRKGKEVFKW